jgi:hypothetical protein
MLRSIYESARHRSDSSLRGATYEVGFEELRRAMIWHKHRQNAVRVPSCARRVVIPYEERRQTLPERVSQ